VIGSGQRLWGLLSPSDILDEKTKRGIRVNGFQEGVERFGTRVVYLESFVAIFGFWLGSHFSAHFSAHGQITGKVH
jgi:hypothetical protein